MKEVVADPVRNPEEYWLKTSISNYALLFIDDKQITLPETEQDLLEDVFGFIKKSERLSGTKTC